MFRKDTGSPGDTGLRSTATGNGTSTQAGARNGSAGEVAGALNYADSSNHPRNASR
jgi:hypothetical protein